MKYFFTLMVFVTILIACNETPKQDTVDPKVKTEILIIDSVNQEMDDVKKEIEETTEALEAILEVL